MHSRVTTLEQSLALAQFTVNLMEDQRGKDEELAQLKAKFETELDTYKMLLGTFSEEWKSSLNRVESLQRSKIQVELELEEKYKKESAAREHMEKASTIEKAEWKRECEKWRIEKNDLLQKWTREKVAVESEVKKRKGLEIDKTRLEREILELQRRADRERTKREELETRWSDNGIHALYTSEVSARSAPISPVSPAAFRFDGPSFAVDRNEEGGMHSATLNEDDVTKKRLRIERGEYERELENLRKENDLLKKEIDFLKKESEYLKKDKRRKSVDPEKAEKNHGSLDRNSSPRLEEDKYDTRRKMSFESDRERADSIDTTRPMLSADTRRKSFGEREDMAAAFDKSSDKYDKGYDKGYDKHDKGYDKYDKGYDKGYDKYDKDKEGDGAVDRPVERRRWDMEREIEMEKWKRQGQYEKDQERTKWKLEKEKELDRLKKYQEQEKASLVKEKEQLRAEKDKQLNELRLKLDEQVVKVQIWEEEVTELTKELKNRELDRLREAAKAEREKSGKQLEEQEREIMRLKTLLYGEKNEWYRLMEQEKAKMKADRSNELEALLKELDAKRAELKAQEREMQSSRHKMDQERLRHQEDMLASRREISEFEERLRKKDAELAKLNGDAAYEPHHSKYRHEKEEHATLQREKEERPKLVSRSSRDHIAIPDKDEKGASHKNSPKVQKPREREPEPERPEAETKKSTQEKEKWLADELRQREDELGLLVKSYDEEKTVLKEHEMKVKMWEEEVEVLEKSHREERDKEVKDLKDTHTKEIKKWERAAEEALTRLNAEKSTELKSLKDAVKQKLAKNEKKYRKQTELLESVQQTQAHQSIEYSILQGEHRMQTEELGALRDKYWKETREWDSKYSAKEAELDKTKTQLKNDVEHIRSEAEQQRKAMNEELRVIVNKMEGVQLQLQGEVRRLENENILLQQLATREKDNATLIARQWAEKERKAAEIEKKAWKKEEQKREEERNAREKDWLSKLHAKFKEIEKAVIEDFAESGGEETAERLLRKMEHVRMLLLADKKLKKKPKAPAPIPPVTTNIVSIISNSSNNNPLEQNASTTPEINPTTNNGGNTTTNNNNNVSQQKDAITGELLHPFVFAQDANPSVTFADLLEKNLDTALRELQNSKANTREMATQLWDLRRQLGDARKYFEKTLHQYEEEANFNMQHLRRSYEEQMDLLKAETKRASRLLEQALNRHATAAVLATSATHPHSPPVPQVQPAPTMASSASQSLPASSSPPPATPAPTAASPTPSPIPNHPTSPIPTSIPSSTSTPTTTDAPVSSSQPP